MLTQLAAVTLPDISQCMLEGKSNFEFHCNSKATEYQHIKSVSIPGTATCDRLRRHGVIKNCNITQRDTARGRGALSYRLTQKIFTDVTAW